MKPVFLFFSLFAIHAAAQGIKDPLLTSPTPATTPTKPTDPPPNTSDTKLTTPTKPTDSTPPVTSPPSTTPTTTTPPSTSNSTTPATTPTTTPPPTASPLVTTLGGLEVTVYQTQSVPQTSASPSPSKAAANNNGGSDSGLGTGSIIGLSVAGGIALIGIIAFFVWKFTRKRFSDFDDNEAIKWPDLNNHGGGPSDSHPLPVKNTGRSGFDTGSEGSLSRVPSNNYSTPDFNPNVAPDPYAVPPLPHLNPNQPYRDDPAGYYDPYNGPIPGTLEHGPAGSTEWGAAPEAIPMTQLGTGRMSPGPHAAYPTGDMAGRQSPGPYAAYGGRSTSPGPQAAYGGRMSPGPQAAYNVPGTAAPGAQRI